MTVLLVMESKQCFALFFSTSVLYLHDCTKVSETFYLITPQSFSNKDALSDPRQLLATKKCFLFYMKISFRTKDTQIFVLTFLDM